MADDSRDQIQISVRMPADLVSALERRAEQEDRTLSAEIRRITRRSLTDECQRTRMEEAA
jgi:plasmid stability protein